MRNNNHRRRGVRLSRVLTVRRGEVYEVMRRGGFDTVTAAVRALFPRLACYWIAGSRFVIVLAS